MTLCQTKHDARGYLHEHICVTQEGHRSNAHTCYCGHVWSVPA